MKLLILVLFLILIKFSINAFRFIKTKNLYKKFKSGKDITSYIPEIDILFKNANTSYRTTYDQRKHGYLERNVRDVAYLSDRKEYFYEVDKVFHLTIGVYRMRMKNSINPFYWIFLPTNLLYTHNVNLPVLLKIMLNLVYLAVGFLASYHLNAFLDFIYLGYFQSILRQIL